MRQIKFCLLELAGVFSSEYFWSTVGWICGYRLHRYGGLTVNVVKPLDLLLGYRKYKE